MCSLQLTEARVLVEQIRYGIALCEVNTRKRTRTHKHRRGNTYLVSKERVDGGVREIARVDHEVALRGTEVGDVLVPDGPQRLLRTHDKPSTKKEGRETEKLIESETDTNIKPTLSPPYIS